MARTVWLVTEGEYDDMRAVAAFESDADAAAAVELGVGDSIQSCDLFGSGEMPTKHTTWVASAKVWNDGLVGGPTVSGRVWWGVAEVPAEPVRVVEGSRLGSRREFSVQVVDDRDAAVKALMDHVGALSA